MTKNIIIILTILVVTPFSYLNAFTLNNTMAAAFESDTVKVNIAENECLHIGITNNELLSLVEEAIDKYWNTVPTSRLRLQAGSLVSVSTKFYTDEVCKTGTNCEPNPDLIVGNDILIGCNDNEENFTDYRILGIAVPNNISNRTINGALFLINDRDDNILDQLSRNDILATIAHELGHTIGLGHSPVEDSLMYYKTIPTRRALGQDDIDGVTFLYPTMQPFGGCGTLQNVPLNRNGILSFFIGFFIIVIAASVRFKTCPSNSTL